MVSISGWFEVDGCFLAIMGFRKAVINDDAGKYVEDAIEFIPYGYDFNSRYYRFSNGNGLELIEVG